MASMNFGPEWIRTLTESKALHSSKCHKQQSPGFVVNGIGPRYRKEDLFERVESMLKHTEHMGSKESKESKERKEDKENKENTEHGEARAEESPQLLLLPPDYLSTTEYCREKPSRGMEDGSESASIPNMEDPANSEVALRFYIKEGLLHCLAEESLSGDQQHAFERHRSMDTSSSNNTNNNTNTTNSSSSSSNKGPRSYERSMSDRGSSSGGGARAFGGNKWYERGGGGGTEEKLNGSSTSPRKSYTRVPYDDWRKTPSSNSSSHNNNNSGGSINSHRWSVWRSPLDSSETSSSNGFRKFDFPKSSSSSGGIGGGSSKNPKWREESSYKMSSYRGGLHGFRRRQETTDVLPEWANDDVPLDKLGGSFDSAGKFQQPFKGSTSIEEEKVVGEMGSTKDNNGKKNEEMPPSPVEKSGDHFESSNNSNNNNGLTEDVPERRKSPDKVPQDSLPRQQQRESEIIPHQQQQEQRDDQKKHSPSAQQEPQHQAPLLRMSDPPANEEYKWIYLDPEGKTQGSFPSIQMLDWFQKGYFPPDLRLRRTIDKRFMQLSEFTKMVGYMPFLPGIQFPPLEAEDEAALKQQQQQQQQIREREQAVYMRQLQAQLLMQQLLQQEQQIQQQQQFMGSLQPQQRPDPHLINKLMQMLGQNGNGGAVGIPPNTPSPSIVPIATPNMNVGGGNSNILPPLLNGGTPAAAAPPVVVDPIKQLLAQQQQQIRSPHFPESLQNVPLPPATLPQAQPPQPTVIQQPQNYDPIKSLLAQLQLSNGPQPPQAPASTASGVTNASSSSSGGGSYFNNNTDPRAIGPLESQPQPNNSIWDLERGGVTTNAPTTTTSNPNNNIQSFKNEAPISQIWNKSSPPLIQPQAAAGSELSFQLQQMQQMQNLERLKQQEELLKRQKQEELLRQQEELERNKEELRRQQEEFEKQQELLLRQKEFQQMNGHLKQQQEEEPPQNFKSNEQQQPVADTALDQSFGSVPEKEDDFEGERVNLEEFVKPKFNEKKDRKSRKADEKRKSREAKKEVSNNQQKYIPGMEGSQKPSEPIVAGGGSLATTDEYEEYEGEVSETQEEALSRLREEQQAALYEKERLHQTHQPPVQPKLAPWAKKMEETTQSNDLSLEEIQRIEVERELEARIQKEAQMQELMKLQAATSLEEQLKEESLITPNTKWTQPTQAEDFLQIVEEEVRLEKARQEKEKKNKKSRQKDIGLAQASVWGTGTANLSWASKTSSNIAPPPPPAQMQQQQQQRSTAPKNVVAAGFWDDSPSTAVISAPQKSAPPPQKNSDSPANKSKKSAKKVKEDCSSKSSGADSGEQQQQQTLNPFEEWCTNTLKSYNVQVDIPTFLSFLESIESPFEVIDYVSSYIDEGKGHKNFAKEYLERRSKWKNSLKTANRMEDNLMAPATAINPRESSEFQTVKNNKAKKQRAKGGKAQKMDMSHLLGFSVASNRINAGELDMPH